MFPSSEFFQPIGKGSVHDSRDNRPHESSSPLQKCDRNGERSGLLCWGLSLWRRNEFLDWPFVVCGGEWRSLPRRSALFFLTSRECWSSRGGKRLHFLVTAGYGLSNTGRRPSRRGEGLWVLYHWCLCMWESERRFFFSPLILSPCWWIKALVWLIVGNKATIVRSVLGGFEIG